MARTDGGSREVGVSERALGEARPPRRGGPLEGVAGTEGDGEAVVGLGIDGQERERDARADRLLGGRPLDEVLSDRSQDELTDALLRAPCAGVELATRDGVRWDVAVVPSAAGATLVVRRVRRPLSGRPEAPPR